MNHLHQTIGKYKLTRLIGEGGMAAVYEGVHETLQTKVAVKILNPILSTNQQIRERFVNEAKIMASFNHPNITRIIDFE
jgi:eukaryotic-like serine/threonine-protein kinase